MPPGEGVKVAGHRGPALRQVTFPARGGGGTAAGRSAARCRSRLRREGVDGFLAGCGWVDGVAVGVVRGVA